ncbi:Calx-beta domain-containing protein, partial [Chloroflexota bacterium]
MRNFSNLAAILITVVLLASLVMGCACEQGLNGLTGAQGSQGLQELQGEPGPEGPDEPVDPQGGQGIGTIIDNSPQPTLSIDDVTVNEDSGYANFTVTLSSPSSLTVTVYYSTANANAAAGEDYNATSGTLTFSPGTTVQTIFIRILDDSIYEAPETFNLNLSNPTNAVILDDRGIGTVIDNDAIITEGQGIGTDIDYNPQPTLSIDDVTVNEDSGYANFTVTLSSPSSLTVTVYYSTDNVTAIAGEDYTASSGTLPFSPGTTVQPISIP